MRDCIFTDRRNKALAEPLLFANNLVIEQMKKLIQERVTVMNHYSKELEIIGAENV